MPKSGGRFSVKIKRNQRFGARLLNPAKSIAP
jgi:hypothetical protein